MSRNDVIGGRATELVCAFGIDFGLNIAISTACMDTAPRVEINLQSSSGMPGTNLWETYLSRSDNNLSCSTLRAGHGSLVLLRIALGAEVRTLHASE